MRPIIALACTALIGLVSVSSANAAGRFVVYGKDVAAVPMTAKGAKGDVKYTMKSAKWPSGTVRVMTFKKADGGVLHPIGDETEIFVLSGSAEVDVAGAPVVLKAGDMASWAKGNIRSAAGAAEDTVIVTWNVAALNEGATPAVVRGADVKEGRLPPENPTLLLKRYDFPGNSIRVVKQLPGGKPSEASAKTDSLIYMTSGRAGFTEDGEKYEVGAGDFLWEEAGKKHFWEISQESGFVTTSGLPKGAAPIDPANATDRPK